MEEDENTPKSIPPWVELEYTHMLTLAGRDARVHFTHLSKSSCQTLSAIFQASESPDLAKASCYEYSVLDLIKASSSETGAGLEKVCLLDPKAEQELSPEDGNGRFEYFLFGGILGDDPPRDRTSELRALGSPTRHLGSVQMTTDTALGVTKLVVDDGIPLNEIPYIDFPTIRFNSKESVEMPFRYIADGSEPRLPAGMKELLYEDLNKPFDF